MLTLLLCLSAAKRDCLPNRRMTSEEKEELEEYMDEFDSVVDALGLEIGRGTRRIVRRQLKDFVKSNGVENQIENGIKKNVHKKSSDLKQSTHLIRKKPAFKKYIVGRRDAMLY